METTLKSLSDEATKHKSIRRQVEKERDELRAKTKSVDQSTEDYKALWQETTQKLTKVQERTKTADIRSALTEQLTKSKVASDKFDAALDLVDRSLIEWDEDAGVDSHSVVAAVQKAKSKYGFLFEMTVAPTDPKPASEGGIKNSITRAAFEALSPSEKVAKVKAKVQVTD
jgi:chromosome segregation ATPase